MIESKQDLKEYINADLLVQPRSHSLLIRLFGDSIVKFKKHLRYCEYCYNTHPFLWKIRYFYHKIICHVILRRYCSEIPINCFGKGLKIWHMQRIIVNGKSNVGDYCSLSSGVVIAHAHDECPTIGNYCELMIDSKVLGGIIVPDHCRIGAGALVIKDINEPNTTWGGVPAKKISNRGTIERPMPVF